MEWSINYKAELDELLRLFVRLTKEERRCHVLMATSEYGYQDWLNQGVGIEVLSQGVVIAVLSCGERTLYCSMMFYVCCSNCGHEQPGCDRAYNSFTLQCHAAALEFLVTQVIQAGPAEYRRQHP